MWGNVGHQPEDGEGEEEDGYDGAGQQVQQ